MRILLVEDDRLISKSLEMLFKQKRIEVVSTHLGREAIGLLQREKFDRIVCDLMLHDITGFEVLESAKSFFSAKEIENKFVIITAYCSGRVLERAEKYGCLIVRKPFEDLYQSLDLLIGGTNEKN